MKRLTKKPACVPPYTAAEKKYARQFVKAFSQLAVMLEQLRGPDVRPTLKQAVRMLNYSDKQWCAIYNLKCHLSNHKL